MRIAFHSPMKVLDDPTPSGDQAMARLFVEALTKGGAKVQVVDFRSYDRGEPARQRCLEAEGAEHAASIVEQIGDGRLLRPDLWFTYHLYHKAPDHLGPIISSALGIPYVVAEASHAPKQAGGPWDIGFRAAERAIRAADRIYCLNPVDAACLVPLVKHPSVLVDLPPFIDTRPFASASDRRVSARAALAARLETEPTGPVILTVAMMRDDQKLRSYAVLADALGRIDQLGWTLLVVGSGPAEAAVHRLFSRFGDRVHFAGRLEGEALADAYAAADLFAWPAVKEAFGVAFIEAAAAGLAIVAGRSGGIAHIVEDGRTGLVVDAGDAVGMAAALERLLRDPAEAAEMRRLAAVRARDVNDIAAAAELLRNDLADLVSRHRADPAA